MEVLNGVVSKCVTMTCSNIGKSSSSVVASSKTQLSFTNKGHLDYYGEAAKGKKGWNGISTKKKIKLLKTLTKDLSTFSHLSFGFNFDHINQASPPPHHNNDSNNNNNNTSIIIPQAAEVLLAQLKQLRTEEKLLKKKEKEDKKKKCKNSKCGSSSSESESSDSECDNKVVDIKRLRNASIVQPNETYSSSSDIPSLTTSSLREPANEQIPLNLDQECSNMILEATLNQDTPIDILSSETSSNLKQSDMGKRIEVCMGGKCKKSGAPALLEELHKAIGEDGGVVIGCKCMGKCKSAPNVKVSTAQTLAHDSLSYPTNPLYIGVGLEDVELIVATYFGEQVKGLGMSVASVAS